MRSEVASKYASSGYKVLTLRYPKWITEIPDEVFSVIPPYPLESVCAEVAALGSL